MDSTNQVHLSKTWIKTKLSGDRASYRIRGAQYKMKARDPCTESRGWNFYLPFVVFSTIYQGGFFFFFKPLFLFAISCCESQKARTLRYECRHSPGPGSLPTTGRAIATHRRLGFLSHRLRDRPKLPEVPSDISLFQGLAPQPTEDG